MAQESFGNRLAEARRRRGLSLEQVHNQLRITPAILEALEYADFRHMPLKGHARNMVSSYARFLGLDPEEITKAFLREYHEYENHEARRSSAPFGSLGLGTSSLDISSRESRPRESSSRDQGGSTNAGPGSRRSISTDSISGSRRINNSENNRSTKSIWDKSIPGSELSQGHGARLSTSRRITAPQPDSRSQYRDGRVSSSYGGSSYTTRPSLPMRLFGTLFKNPISLVVVLIVVLVALLIVWAMVANGCKKKENDIIPINTSAQVTDTSTVDANTIPAVTDITNAVDKTYGPFELDVEPAAGTTPWVEVTVDGQSVCAELLSEKKTWQVTDSCTVSTGQPDNLTVTRNGQQATLNIDPDTGLGSTTQVVIQRPADQGTTANATGTTGDTGSAATGTTGTDTGGTGTGGTGTGTTGTGTTGTTGTGTTANTTTGATDTTGTQGSTP